MEPIISIVIPCYNSGEFLMDAIQSVEKYKGPYKYDIIIVNDGSTDAETLSLLIDLASKGYQIIHQNNKGAAAARNTGVRNSNCEYILFVDSDNKIIPEYIDEGINALKNNPDVGVVYSKAIFFGESSRGKFDSHDFDIQLLLTGNYIDMCSVIRKEVWEAAGGMDEAIEMRTYEDWEFWISVYKTGWKFLFIDRVLFYYRIRSNSLMSTDNRKIYQDRIKYIYNKHADLVYQQYFKAVTTNIIYEQDKKRPFRSFIKYLKYSYLSKNKK